MMESPSYAPPPEMRPLPNLKEYNPEPYLAPAVVEHDPMNDTDFMTIMHKERRSDSPQAYNP